MNSFQLLFRLNGQPRCVDFEGTLDQAHLLFEAVSKDETISEDLSAIKLRVPSYPSYSSSNFLDVVLSHIPSTKHHLFEQFVDQAQELDRSLTTPGGWDNPGVMVEFMWDHQGPQDAPFAQAFYTSLDQLDQAHLWAQHVVEVLDANGLIYDIEITPSRFLEYPDSPLSAIEATRLLKIQCDQAQISSPHLAKLLDGGVLEMPTPKDAKKFGFK